MRSKKFDWPALLEDYRRSGLSAREFTRRRGMSESSLSRELRKEREGIGKTSAGFIEVRVGSDQPKAEIKISLANGRAIHLAASDVLEEKLVARLIRLCETC